MQYYTPDMLGTDSRYLQIGVTKVVYKTGQKIDFGDALFADTLKIVVSGPGNIPLEPMVDFTWDESDIEPDAYNVALLTDSKFNRDLIHSITIQKAIVSNIVVTCSYQKFYPVNEKLLFGNDNDETLEISSITIIDMLRSINQLKATVASITNPVGQSDYPAKLLQEDPLKERSENNVVGEIHTVDVPSEKNIIFPKCHAFYGDDVKVYIDPGHGEEKTYFVEGKDYLLYGLDQKKTTLSKTNFPIYKYIVILRSYVGDLRVDYHAYGGDVTIDDVEMIEKSLLSIKRFINTSKFVTQSNMASAPIVQKIMHKLTTMEDSMRILAQDQRPNYGDSTDNVVLKKIKSPDGSFHWWNVASLYKVDGSNDIFTADTLNLRIRGVYTGLMLDVNVSFNADNPAHPLQIHTVASNIDPKYTPFESYEKLDELVYPRLRVIYNGDRSVQSGFTLQIGMNMKQIAVETLVFEDRSGVESCWKLYPAKAQAEEPQDNYVMLPSQTAQWTDTNPESYSHEKLIPVDEGYIIYAGSEYINDDDGLTEKDIPLIYTDPITDIKVFNSCDVVLKERNGRPMTLHIPLYPYNNTLFGKTTFVYGQKHAYISLTYRIEDGHLKMHLSSSIQSTAVAPLDLYHIVIR